MEKDEDNGGRGYSAGLGIRTFCGAWFHWESQITNAEIKFRTAGKAGAQEAGEGNCPEHPSSVSQRPMCQSCKRGRTFPVPESCGPQYIGEEALSLQERMILNIGF